MGLISSGYLLCKDCGSIFTADRTEPPCYEKPESELFPSNDCIACTHYLHYLDHSTRCPRCGSSDYKKISGVTVRLKTHFRK